LFRYNTLRRRHTVGLRDDSMMTVADHAA